MRIESAAAPAAAAASPARDDDAALRKACTQLEAVFMEQLMKALRETVPEGGVMDGGAGEDIFSGLLNGQLTESAASRLERGIGAALYRQLRGTPPAAPAAAVAPAAGTAGTAADGALP